MHADDVTAIDELRGVYGRLKKELSRVIVGQEQVIEHLSICLFSRGHALLMGVPGLAKTPLVSSFAETMELEFSRIQFTPDLMPMDITGTDILKEVPGGKREFEFAKGPLFANIILADEINRAPSKTQAAMLEAMQEYKVTARLHGDGTREIGVEPLVDLIACPQRPHIDDVVIPFHRLVGGDVGNPGIEILQKERLLIGCEACCAAQST